MSHAAFTFCVLPRRATIADRRADTSARLQQLPVRFAPLRFLSMETAASEIPLQWREEFEAAARRPLPQRIRYSFIRTYKPVLDDASYRSWESTAEYRKWCERNLPGWLGYGGV